jgi:hypothetical protein
MSFILKYILVFFASSAKFILGPAIGLSYDISWPIISLLTTGGMMFTVYIVCFFGDPIRALMVRIFGKSKRKVFSKRSRRFVEIWNLYGIWGIALLTPILLSPPGGTFLAIALGGHKPDIIKWMWISSVFFSIVLTLILKYASWLISVSI